MASRHHRHYTYLHISICSMLQTWLASPPCTAVHTTCSQSCSKYPYDKIFRWRKFLEVEQYLSKIFFNKRCRLKIFSLSKKANYGTTRTVYVRMYVPAHESNGAIVHLPRRKPIIRLIYNVLSPRKVYI